MRLLIAGWQGQVAKAFAEVAPRAADITSCALGRPALDICKAPTIERALAGAAPDVIINTAAYTEVGKAEQEPEQAFALNRDGAGFLALAAARRGIPIIHLSSDRVFDGLKPDPYNESDAPAPQGVYGRSKLEGEDAVRRANPKHVILRTGWVFSAGGRNFVRTILDQAGAGETLRVVSDQRGSPTYAVHLAEAILEIARRVTKSPSDRQWGVFHAAGSGSASWYELAREVLRLSAELRGPVAPLEAIRAGNFPTEAGRAGNSQLDCSKLCEVFGVRLPGWEVGVADCVSRLVGPKV